MTDRYESPQAAERAFETAVDVENARRDRKHEREMLEHLGMKPAQQG